MPRGGQNQIVDAFTDLPVSRQRKWQLRRQAAGLCEKCGQPSIPDAAQCLKCLKKARDRYVPTGVRRTYNCPSRREEQP